MHDKLATPFKKAGSRAILLALAFGFVGFAIPKPALAASFTLPSPTTPATQQSTPVGATQPLPPIIVLPPPITRPPIVVPTDVTSPQLVNPDISHLTASPEALALNGVQALASKEFPSTDMLTGNSDWITVLAKDGAQFTKPNNFTVDLKQGDIIVSVKEPSKLAFVTTEYGTIAIGANGDCMICFNNGVLRILNFDGAGKTIKAELNKGPFANPQDDPTVAIACGYELIASDSKISHAILRPSDGIARRYSKVLETGHLAISEFSLESAMKSCDMLVQLEQKTNGVKERRMLSDMTKMAAVLNYKVGNLGFH
jgi:hypothetical protein